MQEVLSWSPQMRSRWYYSPLFLIILGIIAFIFVIVGLCTKHIELIIFAVGLYILNLFWVSSELGRWEVSGYKTITIDRTSRLLIFDNKIKIPFSVVSKMNFDTLPPPERPWWLRDSKTEWLNHIAEFNAFLEIITKSGERVSFAIQDRFDAQEIIKSLKLCGFDIYMTTFDETELKRSWVNYIFFISTLIIIFLIINLFHK